MKGRILAVLAVSALLAIGCNGNGNKYSKGKAMLAVVELGPFPPAAANVAGYSLYMAEKPEGPFKRINTELILPQTSLMVPYLNLGQDYYFRMSAITKEPRREGAQGQVFSRKAAASKR